MIGSQGIVPVYILRFYFKECTLMTVHEVTIKLLVVTAVPVVGGIEGDI